MAAGVAISHANNNRIASNHSRLRDLLCDLRGLRLNQIRSMGIQITD